MKMNRNTISCILIGICLPVSGMDLDRMARQELGRLARPVGSPADLTPLIERASSSRLVLLGEATHGTSEFYSWRAAISRRLIEEAGFRFIAVEGDWASCFRLNRYVKDLPGAEADAREVMRSFDRWPEWMWANEETLELIEWMREFNLDRPLGERVGFYGMDVYGDDQALQRLLEKVQALCADLAEEVEAAYGPFIPYVRASQWYPQTLRAGDRSFAESAAAGLALLKERTAEWPGEQRHARLNLLQSARVVQHAERHFRAMRSPGTSSWNARADAFFDTVQRLLDFYGPDAQGVAWAHNTHIGDARATPMGTRGDRNIGQAARTALGRGNVTAVGFGTWRGTVVAGRQWGSPREVMTMPPGMRESYEDLMNDLGHDAALFLFDPDDEGTALAMPRGHRAAGVVYNPQHEVPGNYVPTLLTRRYDAFIFLRETRALQPID